MVVPVLPDLDEKYPLSKIINHFLKPTDIPPFDGEIQFAASNNYPKRNLFSHNFPNLGEPRLFTFCDVNISFECRWRDLQTEFLIEEINKTLKKMARPLVALMDQWVFAI